MGLGLLDLVGLAVALAFAVPMAGVGLSLLARGRPLGVAFLGLAGLFLLVEHALMTPSDIPGRVLERLTESAVADPDDPSERD